MTETNEETKKSTSPVPQVDLEDKANPTIDFPMAMANVIKGKKITKIEWNNVKIYGYLSLTSEHLTLHKEDGKDYDWTVSKADMVGEDWIILP